MSEIPEELQEHLEDLLDYFELHSEDSEWPMVSVYNQGEYITGVISDELYSILYSIKNILNNTED